MRDGDEIVDDRRDVSATLPETLDGGRDVLEVPCRVGQQENVVGMTSVQIRWGRCHLRLPHAGPDAAAQGGKCRDGCECAPRQPEMRTWRINELRPPG